MDELQVLLNQESTHECMTCGEDLHSNYPVYECDRCLSQSPE
ncbi:hypothetical protein [Tumebacillus flagellatus]|nr:hypothetical protein [Tumebacillus flagellatus]